MAISRTIKVSCDVCRADMGESQAEKMTRLTVIFTTEQTEGRSVKPYLTNEMLHICDKCMSHVLDGNMLFGAGAQGYNNYFFKSKE